MPRGARRAAMPRGTPRSGSKSRRHAPGLPQPARRPTDSSAWPRRTRSKPCSTRVPPTSRKSPTSLAIRCAGRSKCLIQSLDRADQDHGRELLRVNETKLYEAALTVMMRLVFLFCAEERELLLLGDELYDQNYALSTMREQLRATADQFGEEILERRARRLVPAADLLPGRLRRGVWHDRLKLPRLRWSPVRPGPLPVPRRSQAGTTWKDTPRPAAAGQQPHRPAPARSAASAASQGAGRRTCRGPAAQLPALDIDQIGHVYEGLLDHTGARRPSPCSGWPGPRDQEPEVPLSKLEEPGGQGRERPAHVPEGRNGPVVGRLKRLLKVEFGRPDGEPVPHGLPGGRGLWERVQPFAGLVRLDSFGYPVVILPRSVYVTAGPTAAPAARTTRPKPDRADREVHAGAAGLRRPRRGHAQGAVETEVARNCST